MLAQYVAQNPEKNAYVELTYKNEQWIIPVPGSLEGVKSRGRQILKMNGVAFRYPTHEKPTVQDITLSVCMALRVAVIGANGAGKSTAIKLFVGELKPEVGTIWRHADMRLTYVAQHAFHHLESAWARRRCSTQFWRLQFAFGLAQPNNSWAAHPSVQWAAQPSTSGAAQLAKATFTLSIAQSGIHGQRILNMQRAA